MTQQPHRTSMPDAIRGERRDPVRGGGLPRRARGGTILGFLIGLIVGLTIAVVVALFVTRGATPFVNKVSRPADRLSEPKTAADAPDPNKPLYSKTRPAPQEGEAQAPEAPPEDRGGILERLFGKRAAEPATPTRPADKPVPTAGAKPAEARPADTERTSYLLQAGAFRGPDEAEAMRARLALVGFEAKVASAEVNGQTLYRVRVGPFGQLEDMNTARARLADNGIEASVVRLK